jgi:hypothetical protein
MLLISKIIILLIKYFSHTVLDLIILNMPILILIMKLFIVLCFSGNVIFPLS